MEMTYKNTPPYQVSGNAGAKPVSFPEDLEPSTATLIEQFQDGDKYAFGTLWTRYEGVAHKKIAGLTGRRDPDIAQDTALRVLGALPNFTATDRVGQEFGSYVSTVTHNRVLDIYRKDSPIPLDLQNDTHQRMFEEGTPAFGERRIQNPEDIIVNSADVLAAGLTEQVKDKVLPEFLEAIIAVDIGGQLEPDYAAKSGININTVRTRLHRGRKRIRTLAEEGKIDLGFLYD